MQLDSRVMNDVSEHGDAIAAARYLWCFLPVRWICTPHPPRQQKVHHARIRKLPSPNVKLSHACAAFLFITAMMQNWSGLA